MGTWVLKIVVSIDIYLQYIHGWMNSKWKKRDGEMARWISSRLGDKNTGDERWPSSGLGEKLK
jgi:hypothetical protein